MFGLDKFNGDIFFSMSHILMLVFVALTIAAICIFGNKITPYSKLDKCLRYIPTIICVSLEIGFFIWVKIVGYKYSAEDYFGWCFICFVLVSINLFVNNEKLVQYTLAPCIMGATLALIVVDIQFLFPHFRYFHYFLTHALFIIGNIYLVIVHRHKITIKSQLRTSFVIGVAVIPFIIINYIAKTNFFYLASLPSEVNFLLEWAGVIQPYVWMLVVFILMFAIAWPFIKLTKKRDKVFTMKLHDEPFKLIEKNSKTIELRLNDERRKDLKVNDTIEFTNNTTNQTMKVSIKRIYKFNSFEELYQNLDLIKCGYTQENIIDAKPSDMDIYYSKELQSQYGVLGIEIIKK